MKKALKLLIAILAIAVSTFYLTGIMAEKHIKASIENLQNSYGDLVPFVKTSLDYNRGWFTSTAVSNMTFDFSDSVGPITFKVASHINHGPILLNDPNFFGLASININTLIDEKHKVPKIWKDDQNSIKIQGHIDFNGDLTISIAGIVAKNNIGDDYYISIKPINLTINLSDNQTRMFSNFNWDGMQLHDKEMNITLGKLTGHSKKHLLLGNIWLGSDEYTLSEITMSPQFRLEGLAMSTHSDADVNQLIDESIFINIEKITSKNTTFANNIKLIATLKNLPAKSLQSINEKIAELQKKFYKQVLQPESTVVSPVPDVSLFSEELNQIIAAGPIIKISTMQADTKYGRVEAGLEASIKTGNNLTSQQDPSQLLLMLMTATNALANISIPFKLIEDTPFAKSVPGHINKGYIIKEKGQLRLYIKFQQGQLTINNKPIMTH